MLNLQQLNNLQQILITLEHIALNIEDKILELSSRIHCGEFLSGSLNRQIQSELNELYAIQEEFSKQFTALFTEPLPSTINAARTRLEEYRKKAETVQKYQESIRFFMALHSEDESVETLLEKRKRTLSSLNFMIMDEPQMQEICEIYTQLFDAFQEKDPMQRFSRLYKMAPYLESQIAAEIQFGTLNVSDFSKNDWDPIQAEPEYPSAHSQDQEISFAFEASAKEQEHPLCSEEYNTEQGNHTFSNKGNIQQEKPCLPEELNIEQKEFSSLEEQNMQQKKLSDPQDNNTKHKIYPLTKESDIQQEKTSIPQEHSPEQEKCCVPQEDNTKPKNHLLPKEGNLEQEKQLFPQNNSKEPEAPCFPQDNNKEPKTPCFPQDNNKEPETSCFPQDNFIKIWEKQFLPEKEIDTPVHPQQDKEGQEGKLPLIEDHHSEESVSPSKDSPFPTTGETESEVSSRSLLAEDETIWKTLEIRNPEEMITKEDLSLLEVHLSPKASEKPRVKEFKNEVTKPKEIFFTKIDCLTEAYESFGYSRESIAIWKNKEVGYYDFVTQKLWQSGYLKQYTVKNAGEFYVLSIKGDKLFTLQDALSFIRKYSRKKVASPSEKYFIEDKANSAINRMLCQSAFSKTLSLDPEYEFYKRFTCVGNDYFFIGFPEVSDCIDILFLGITSDDPKQFKEFYEYMKQINKKEDLYIVIGFTRETARATAKWIAEISDAPIPVWYCEYSDNSLFDSATDCLADIEDVIENMVFEEEESMEITVTEETGSDETTPNKIGQNKTNSNEIDQDKVDQNENHLTKADSKETANDEAAIAAEPEHTLVIPYPEPKQPPGLTGPLSESEKETYDSIYEEMLADKKFYCATAYVKALSKHIPYYDTVYRQLAYALNDPMNGCNYRSDTIFNVFCSDENPLSDYYVIAAGIRNYFLNQFNYDYSLQQLQTMLSGNRILQKEPILDQILYTLQQFKIHYHTGIDCYADYREKERASFDGYLEENRREAKSYYDQYSAGALKENTSHKRFIETAKLLVGSGSDLSEYLQIVINDDRSMTDLLEDFLRQHYIKDQTDVCEDNIDSGKIDLILDSHWELAAQNMRLVKKTSDLMGSLRMNLFKRVNKIVRVLCNYVFLIKSTITNEDNPALQEYRKIRNPLLNDIDSTLKKLSQPVTDYLPAIAGNRILIETLEEMKARLNGDYKEGSHKYFYIPFLKNDKVLLDDNFLPILDDVLELPAFSVQNRILDHYRSEELDWDTRLNEIINGKDDYGSAELILKYLKTQKIPLANHELLSISLEEAAFFPQQDMIHKRSEFIEDLELAQSYGQIDNTVENSKETMIQVMDAWYQWANDTKNYGFFAKILTAFKERIREDAQARAVELEQNLNIYLQENPKWKKESLTSDAVSHIRDRIQQQNYAAAEDLLNRLLTNDLDIEVDLHQTDYLVEFLNEYEINYRKTANSGATLKSLLSPYQINKDTKGASRLLENWPRGFGVGDAMLRSLLTALGFHPDLVKEDPAIQGKMKSYLVTLMRPQNGRKNNYKHPISAFGSEAENNGFRVVCIFGKSDASRLIDTFKEIGNAKNTLVLLDYALTLADRRTLARKTKTDLNGKIFAVIDRITIFYLAKHYTETAVNRMLMAVIMPFASYQPYIDKSADVMPQEIFIGRKKELEKIESPTGVNIVYGGRQLGKTALLRMAQKNIDMDENGDRAVIVNAWRKDYKKTATAISKALYDEGILKTENITEDWNELARDIKNRLRDTKEPIPYFLLMIDEADSFIESCETIDYQPFNALKDIQAIGSGRFKFVVAGLRNIVRFKQTAALNNNGVLTHLDSLTVKPFKSTEARELLEVPLSYLGFRFPKDDNETEVLISTIFGTTNYFPGLIQLYCTKLIEAMKKNYAGYSESKTPPYYVREEHIKKVLADQTLQKGIREKFFITLKVGDDDYYYIIALLVAHHYHENKSKNSCDPQDLLTLAGTLLIRKLSSISVEKITALMEEMCELNVLQHTGDGRYRFARHSFCQMMGTIQQIDDELFKYMED